MPRAGFYAIHNSSIRFGKDGRWYADGEPIANDKITSLFARHVRRSAAGTYILEVGPERVPIEVEDTPYVVIRFDVGADGEAVIELNDRSIEQLDSGTLRVSADDVLYCSVKNGTERARFLRAAYYQLAPFISQQATGGFVVRLGGTSHPVERL